jgi:hypothetical protein
MTTTVRGREFDVLSDDGEFVLSRLTHPTDGQLTLLGRPAATPPPAATAVPGGRNARTSRCRGPIVREGGRADNGCSVNWAFVPSMLQSLREGPCVPPHSF